MDSSPRPIQPLVPGIALVVLLSIIATWSAGSPLLTSWQIGPLIVGLLLGVVVGNVASERLPQNLDAGITFSAKKILRLAIILYGFRITFAKVMRNP